MFGQSQPIISDANTVSFFPIGFAESDKTTRSQQINKLCLMTIASWSHTFPSRTGQWNDFAPMIVLQPVWK